jgi:hypothetical protein
MADPGGEVRRVPPIGAFLEGWRRVWRAPVLLLGTAAALWLASRLLAAAAEPPREWVTIYEIPLGFAAPWANRFFVELRNLADVLAPEFAPFFQPSPLPRAIAAGVTIRILMWMFLTGGALDRLARGRPIYTAAFFSACGMYFVRFLRLAAIVILPAYALLRAQRSFGGSLAVQLMALAVLAAGGILADFAKVRAVVEDRHSMFGAIAAAIRFTRRRFGRVLGLALLNGLALLAVVRVEFQVNATAVPSWLAALMSAGMMIVATFARLAMLASEVVFFQGELAHAGYAAAPAFVWPDSPAAEAIDNLTRTDQRNGAMRQ